MSRLLGRPARRASRPSTTTRRWARRCSPGATRSPGTARTGRSAQRHGHGRRLARARRAPAGRRAARRRDAPAQAAQARARRAAFPLAVAALNRAGLGPLRADISLDELRRAGLQAMGEVAARLDLGDAYVVFGHTHRAGPLPGRPRGRVARGAAARGWSTPAAGHTRASSSTAPPARAPTGRARACSSRTTGRRGSCVCCRIARTHSSRRPSGLSHAGPLVPMGVDERRKRT